MAIGAPCLLLACRPASADDEGSGEDTSGETSTSGTETDTGDPEPDLPPDLPQWEMTDPVCGTTPPDDAAEPAPPKAYSEGDCPALDPGLNVLPSSGADREFILVVPDDVQAGEVLPVLFLWHWQQGDANDFLEKGDVQNAAEVFRFIAVIPNAKGDVLFEWPYAVNDTQERLDEELVFFDDMLACVSEQYDVDLSCVSTSGVSAGALMSAQLAGARSDHLSSMLSMSGGVGGLIKPWVEPDHKLPALVLWGGPTDTCIALDFETTSMNLEADLEAGGHFFVECIHNCGHAEPPFDVPGAPTPFAPIWQFALDHPYWLAPGESPYADGLPTSLPTWCGIGAGSAEPREGEGCPEPGC